MKRLNRKRHYLVIADVGGPYHVGDEAMLDCNLLHLRWLAPDASFTVLSRESSITAQRYGAHSVPQIGFTLPPFQRDQDERLLEQVLDGAAKLRQGGNLAGNHPATAQLSALKRADGLILSGGGNLNSQWPHHIYERVALIHSADLLQKPVIILGQTIGPNLETRDRELLASALPLADLVGVRELTSFDIALGLGVAGERVSRQPDDAFFLPSELLHDQRLIKRLPTQDWIAMTFADRPLSIDSLAQQIDMVIRRIQAPILFLPHLTSSWEDDRALGRKLLSRLSTRNKMFLADVLPCRQVRWLTDHAAMIISSRYHPLVFAISAKVPSIGIYHNDYTRAKIQGVLDLVELADWALPLESALCGDLADRSLSLWNKREEVKSYLEQTKPKWEELHRRHWSKVAQALGLEVSERALLRFETLYRT